LHALRRNKSPAARFVKPHSNDRLMAMISM